MAYDIHEAKVRESLSPRIHAFTSPGAPARAWTLLRVSQNLCRKRLLDRPNATALRHSLITQAINDGMTTLEVAGMVGTSLAMIDRNYGKLVPDTAKQRLAAVTML